MIPRSTYAVAVAACVFFVGHLVAIVVMVDTGHVEALVHYMIGMGVGAIFLAVALIVYLVRDLRRKAVP